MRVLRSDTGGVAAEFALTLPAVLLLLAVSCGALAAGAQTVRLQQTAGDAARLLSRGDDARAGQLVSVSAAHLEVGGGDGLVCAHLTAPFQVGPLGLLPLAATACASAEKG